MTRAYSSLGRETFATSVTWDDDGWPAFAPIAARQRTPVAPFVDEFDGRRPKLHGFFSMVDRRRKLHRDFVDTLPTERKSMSTTVIPAAADVEQMAVRRSPVVEFAPRTAAARAYTRFWAEVSGLLEN